MKIDLVSMTNDLNDFFKVNWVKNLPELKILETEEEADKVFEKQRGKKREKWAVGWIQDTQKVIVLKKDLCSLSEEDYLNLIKNELVHSFTLVWCMQNNVQYQKFPKWVWEGLAMGLSGQLNRVKKLEKFEKVLRSFNSYSDGLFQESGVLLIMFIKEFGKGKLFELMKKLNETNSEEEFNKLFAEIYGFELNYEKLNRLLREQK